MNDLSSRLTSRKLWLTVGTVISLAASKQYAAAAGVAVVYLGAQGWVDSKQVNAATEVEKKAHALATQLLDELATSTTQHAPRPQRPLRPTIDTAALDAEQRSEARRSLRAKAR